MSYAFQIDPREVLGVRQGATLAELHEAYRARSKKYHPDAGGDEWAFRILTQAYEILSTARVFGRADEEMRREDAVRAARVARPAGGAATADRNPFEPVRPIRPTGEDAQARRGVWDNTLDPSRLVAVDLLLLRFELNGSLGLLVGTPEERNLSCTLNLTWPASESGTVDPDQVPRILSAILSAFEDACKAVPPVLAESRDEANRFIGLMSYTSALRADEAFKAFRRSLGRHGLGVVQTIRDVTIPREWRD